jgi:hypothetical protein
VGAAAGEASSAREAAPSAISSAQAAGAKAIRLKRIMRVSLERSVSNHSAGPAAGAPLASTASAIDAGSGLVF